MCEGQERATCAECNCRHHGNIHIDQPCSHYCRQCLLRWCGKPQCKRALLWHDCAREIGDSSEDESPTRFAKNSEDGTDESSGSATEGSRPEELACPAVMIEEMCWDDWEEKVEEHRRTQQPSRAARAASTINLNVIQSDQLHDPDQILHTNYQMEDQARICNLDKGNVKQIRKHMDKYLIPCMPTIFPEPKDNQKNHREKLASRELPFNLMVARPVGRQEMTHCPEAQAAMQKEWAALLEQKVWDLMIVREKSDVVNEARRLKKEVQFGRVHGICVEKIANFLKDISHENSKVVLYFWVTK